jgi:hypothetical protein
MEQAKQTEHVDNELFIAEKTVSVSQQTLHHFGLTAYNQHLI